MKQLTQRQASQIHSVSKTVKAPPAPFVGTVVGVPVITQVITQVRQVTKLAEFPAD